MTAAPKGETHSRLTAVPEGVLVRVKAVPGAKSEKVVGWLGDRLKVRVAQAPEGGKANAAICRLLARELGLAERDVEVVKGHSIPEKTVLLSGGAIGDIASRCPA